MSEFKQMDCPLFERIDDRIEEVSRRTQAAVDGLLAGTHQVFYGTHKCLVIGGVLCAVEDYTVYQNHKPRPICMEGYEDILTYLSCNKKEPTP